MRRIRTQAAFLLAFASGLVSAPAWSFELRGTWHVLVHYRDAEAPDPKAWLWEDRVWDLQPQGEALLWTDYELVNFMDVRGRFADLRSAWARRVRGAWEPNASQRREIERGLFVNPRGARTLLLEPGAQGYTSRRRGQAAPELGLTLRRLASIRISDDGLPIFRVTESVHAPDEVHRLRESVFRVTQRLDDGEMTGEYAQSTRRGRFHLRPTRLRETSRAEIRHEEGALVLKPDRIAGWENLVPAVLRPWRYFGERVVRIGTTPPGALLELSYLRDGARRLFEETRAPITVRLPSRFVASPSDVLEIDAFAPGYRPGRALVPLHEETEAVELELEPSANRLVRAWFRTLGGVTSLVLFTEGPLDLHVARGPGRLSLVLADTTAEGEAADLIESIRAGAVRDARAIQLRESLVLRLTLRDPEAAPPRFLRGEGPGATTHRTEMRLPPSDGAAPWPERLVAVSTEPAATGPCVRAFDDALREALEVPAVARALTFADPRVAALLEVTLRRLAAAGPERRIRLVDGTALALTPPLALAMARSRAAEVRGLLAALRETLGALEPDAVEALRGVVAPGLPPSAFARRLAKAENAEAACLAHARSGGS